MVDTWNFDICENTFKKFFFRAKIKCLYGLLNTRHYVTFEGQNQEASFSKELNKVRGQRVV